MAITGIMLSTNRTSASGTTNARLTPASPVTSETAFYVKFRTTYADSQAYVDLAIAYEVVARGDVRGGDGFGGYATSGGSTKWIYYRFPVSDSRLWRSARDFGGPGYLWSLPLRFESSDPTSQGQNLVDLITNGGDWSFANRRFDVVHLHIKVKTLYYDDGNVLRESEVTHQDAYIGWIPDYDQSAVRATYGKSGLVIRYDSPDWDRSTDRWEVQRLTQNGRSLIDTKRLPWGAVTGRGVITIPPSALVRTPVDGTIDGVIRMNATWRPTGLEFSNLTLSGYAVENVLDVNSPTITLAEDSTTGTVRVTVGDALDENVAVATARVRLAGGSLSCDVHEVAVNGSCVLAPPLGTPYVVEATSFDSDGNRGATVRATGGPLTLGDGVYLTPLDGGDTVAIAYNVRITEGASPEIETVKLAGRPRKSVFYGEGGDHTVNVSGAVCIEGGHGIAHVDIEALRSLPYAGPCVMREDTGQRWAVLVKSANVSSNSAPRHMRDVSISCEEVA